MIILSKRTIDVEAGCDWLISRKVRDYALSNWPDFSRAKSNNPDKDNKYLFIVQIPESIADRESMFDLKGVHYI